MYNSCQGDYQGKESHHKDLYIQGPFEFCTTSNEESIRLVFVSLIYFQYSKFILATLRVAGSLAKSTEVMQAMQRLVRVPEVAQTMQDMSKEMMKAGIIEELLDETFEDMEDQEELEDAAQVEVCNLIF